jgi:hypothetical protein
MAYVLVLIFACGSANGCGWPDSVQITPTFSTYEQCQSAGSQWMSLQANPMEAVATFQCASADPKLGTISNSAADPNSAQP